MDLTVEQMDQVAHGTPLDFITGLEGWTKEHEEEVSSSWSKGAEVEVVLREPQDPETYGSGPDPKFWRFTYWFHEEVGLVDMGDNGWYPGVEVDPHAVVATVWREVKRDENGYRFKWL